MKLNAKTPSQPGRERTRLQRFAPAIAVIVVLTIVIAAWVGTVMVLRRDAPRAAPAVEVAVEDLPGPKGQLSERSRQQLTTMANAKDYPHVMATLVIRYGRKPGESPYAYVHGATPRIQSMLDAIVADINKKQAARALTAAESPLLLDDPTPATRALRNSEEARLGLIKCVPLESVTVTYISLKTIATGICYATVPPFSGNAKMAIIMLTDSAMTSYAELAEMRRLLLALQIDIYNRDFEGRETWAHP